ncbi:MAG TPA: DNA-directed RNA polymerase subunit alpha C-terminal domain-containing protein [Allosphingosinicella sp.]|uniref:DNA-directed RNA polymerase subunit alpha C-terminal domain-containing protein n=1 Tax=Allosphingosinicella sp. TaxID=2823234 RepID=UPI002EDA19FC
MGHRSTHRASQLREEVDQRLQLASQGERQAKVASPLSSAPLAHLRPSVRAANLFARMGLKTLSDLTQITPAELLRQPNCGRKTLHELQSKLDDVGLTLRQEAPEEEQVQFPVVARDMLNVQLRLLGLSTRAKNFLRQHQILFAGELCQFTEGEIWRHPNVGRRTVRELKEALSSLGLSLGSNVGDWTAAEARTSATPSLPNSLRHSEPKELAIALRARVDVVAASERNARWTVEHMGWDGKPGRTLESIGSREGVTRERVRQVAAKCCRALQERQLAPLALRQTLALIRTSLPLSQSRLDTLMRERGLASQPFHIDGIKTAAEIFGLTFPFVIRDVPDPLILPRSLSALPSLLLQQARREIGRQGCIVDDHLVELGSQLAGKQVTLNVIHAILESDTTFARISGAGEWWWRPEKALAGRNRLVNTIIKVMAVSPSISIRELRDAARRHVRSGHMAPPRTVLQAICKSLPFLEVEADRVRRLDTAADWSSILNSSENALVEIFRRRGSVVDSYDMSAEGMAIGLNENSLNIYKTYSPLLWRPSPGLYALVGSEIPVGLIEDLKSSKRNTAVSLIDSGWTSDAKILLCYRITKGVWTSGLVGVPTSLQNVLQGGFELLAFSKQSLGGVEVRDATVFSFRKFFRVFGAEEDDTLLLVFDRIKCSCEAWLGGAEMAQTVQDGKSDALLTQLRKQSLAETDEELDSA